MSVSKDEVKYIESLSKLEFEESELEKFTKEFKKIINNSHKSYYGYLNKHVRITIEYFISQ